MYCLFDIIQFHQGIASLYLLTSVCWLIDSTICRTSCILSLQIVCVASL